MVVRLQQTGSRSREKVVGLWRFDKGSSPMDENSINALATLSASLCLPIRLGNVRSDERPAGLRRQHVSTLSFLASLVDAEAGGLHLGSTELDFLPSHAPSSGVHAIDFEPNIDLVPLVESLLTVLCFTSGPASVLLRGGTHIGPVSPDFLEGTLVPVLQSAGVTCNVGCPKGGYGTSEGEIHLHIAPSTIHGFHVSERGELETIDLYIATSNWSHTEIAELVSAVTQSFGNYPHRLHLRDRESSEKGGYVIACIGCMNGRAGFGANLADSEESSSVAIDLKKQFLEYIDSGANVDMSLGQMMLVPAALSQFGGSWTVPEASASLLSLAEKVSDFTQREIVVDSSGHVKVEGLAPAETFPLRL